MFAIFKPVKNILVSSLDTKIEEIKNSIKEAENLKRETQVILSDIKKRQKDVQLEIETIHSKAKTKIQILESQAQEKLDDQTNKRALLTTAKIEQMTRDTNTYIKQYITQVSIEAAITLLKNKLNQNEKQNLINQSIKDLGTVFKN